MIFKSLITTTMGVSIPPFNTHSRPAAQGRWWIDLTRVDDRITSAMNGVSFGDSIEQFHLGFELGDMKAWNAMFAKTRDYVSYRPSRKILLSVAQLDWAKIKLKPPEEQLANLSEEVLLAARRVGNLKRKPKSFDYEFFAEFVYIAIRQIPVESVTSGLPQ